MTEINTTFNFTQKVLQAFKKINAEISIDSLEHDFSPRFAKYFIEMVLGYDGKDYSFERSRTDITLLDENNHRIVVIETKRPREDLNAEKWKNQAGKYIDQFSQFVGLVNGYRFLLWQINKDGERLLKINLDFKSLIETKRMNEDKLTTKEIEQILYLQNITKEQIWSTEKYTKFSEYYAIIDVAEEDGFIKLVEQLNFISNDLLRRFTYSAFDEYYAGYMQYKQTMNELDNLKRQNGKNSKSASELAKFELKTEGKYKKYASFSGFYIWKNLSNRPDDKDEENKQVFCKESIYVLINRLLFIRICEDKGLLKKKISNSGIENLREQLTEPVIGDSEVFKQIIQFSYGGAKQIYFHFYEKDNPLDWYESGNGELDLVLSKVIWLLNQFNFSSVDRDILGKLYEKYLPKEERKRLGEFYTPDEVIDYILDAVGYIPSKAIDGKNLIDPACGSGGFLVRAARRLIARHIVKFEKATPKEAMDNKCWPNIYNKLTSKECEEIINSVATHIHGFDINPFAVSITEMNLLFQVIDLYSKVIKGNRSFKVPRFNIYETDSLEQPIEQTNLAQFFEATGKSLAKDKETTDELKTKKYDFVIGNPPYVNVANLSSSSQIDSYRKIYSETVFRNFDLYMPFIQLGVQMMSNKGKMSYICSNQFMVKEYGKNLREYLSVNVGIEELIDFGDNKVFDSATNYPLIFVFTKEKILKTLCVKVLSSEDNILRNIQKYKISEVQSPNLSFFHILTSEFSNGPWIIRSKDNQILAKRLESFPKLSSRSTFISGLRTGKDGAYFGQIEDNNQPLLTITTKFNTCKIEPTIIKPTLKGKDVRKWEAKPSVFAIFPHSNLEPHTLTMDIMSKEFPNALNYFKGIESILEKRTWFKKTATELHGEFYAMMYYDLPGDFEKAEIVTPALTKTPNFALNTEKALFIGGTAGVLGVCPNMNKHALLGILNSKLFAYYLQTQPIKQGGYRQMSEKSLKDFPIPEENKKIEMDISSIVIQLLRAKKKREDIAKLEEGIDNLVFQLYKITKEERQLIEDSLT